MVDRHGRPILIAGLAFVAFGVLIWFVPFLTTDRTVVVATSSPFPVAAASLVEVPAGEAACLDRVALGPRAEVVQVEVAERAGPAAPVGVEVSGPGYRASATARPGEREGQLYVPVDPPGEPLLGTVCVRNLGARVIALTGTEEPKVQSRSATTVAGEPIAADVSVNLLERERSSLLSRLPQMLDAMTTWKPGIVAVPLLWLLLVAVAGAVGVGVMWTLAASMRAGDGH